MSFIKFVIIDDLQNVNKHYVGTVIVGLVIIHSFFYGDTKLAQHIANNVYLHLASHLLLLTRFNDSCKIAIAINIIIYFVNYSNTESINHLNLNI
jgi:hypothetical protein